LSASENQIARGVVRNSFRTLRRKSTFGSKISEVITKAEEIAPIDPAPLNIRPEIFKI